MKDHLIRQLNGLNRSFYEARGSDFDASRDHPWPGWRRATTSLIDRFGRKPPRTMRVLDVGCGNGRFGGYLSRESNAPIQYWGIDSSRVLLARADGSLTGARDGFDHRLSNIDVVSESLEHALGGESFDLVVAFGVLHHIPGEAARTALLSGMAARVAAAGRLVATAWRFADAPRFGPTTLSHDEIGRRSDLGIDPAELEAGDYLLGFGGKSQVPRYCHHIDDAEFDRVTADLALRECDRFLADGKSGDLNAYRVYERLSAPPPV